MTRRHDGQAEYNLDGHQPLDYLGLKLERFFHSTSLAPRYINLRLTYLITY